MEMYFRCDCGHILRVEAEAIRNHLAETLVIFFEQGTNRSMSAVFTMFSLRIRGLSFVSCLVITFSAFASVQSPAPACQPTVSGNPDGSIAAAAKQSKVQKPARAKKVFTDEDMEVSAGPLPRLRMDGPENRDQIVAAITAYKTGHTPDQIERAVHVWYDRYDEMLAAAIEENQNMQVLRSANMSNGYELCQESGDYEHCQKRQMAEQRGARSDQVQMMKNNQLEVRIQHAFMKVRNGLAQNNLRYEWFKIRTTNGIDSF